MIEITLFAVSNLQNTLTSKAKNTLLTLVPPNTKVTHVIHLYNIYLVVQSSKDSARQQH